MKVARGRRAALMVIMTALAALAACSDDSTGPDDDFFVGTWDLVAFTDAGVAGTTTGTWIFRENGTFTVDGTVTYPSEPTDDLLLDGTWEQDGDTVTLVTDGVSTNWTFTSDGDVTTLTEVEAAPANVIQIRKR